MNNEIDTNFLHRSIPLSQHMGLRVDSTKPEVHLRLPLTPNLNHLGTSFGGSQLSACAIACWVYLLKIFESGSVAAEVVLQSNESRFYKPVTADALIKVVPLAPAASARIIKALQSSERASVVLSAEVWQDDELRTEYTGRYICL